MQTWTEELKMSIPKWKDCQRKWLNDNNDNNVQRQGVLYRPRNERTDNAYRDSVTRFVTWFFLHWYSSSLEVHCYITIQKILVFLVISLELFLLQLYNDNHLLRYILPEQRRTLTVSYVTPLDFFPRAPAALPTVSKISWYCPCKFRTKSSLSWKRQRQKRPSINKKN